MRGSRGFLTVAALVGVAIPSIWLASLVLPGEEAVKVRNALVVELGEPKDFDWSPDAPPASFKLNKATPAARFSREADALAQPSTGPSRQGLELGLAIARHLIGEDGATSGFPIQSSLEETYRRITRDGQGYCADYTFVFSGLAVAAGLPVRTWSISFESFGAGHTFNEVYDSRLEKWVLVDAYHGLYFVDPESRQPMSVLEVHAGLLERVPGRGPPAVERIAGDWLAFSTDQRALDYYRRGMPQLALSWGNNVFDYDQSPAVRAAARVSRHLERAVAIAIGVYPKVLVYPESVSWRDLSAIERVRNTFVLATASLAVSFTVFGVLLYSTWNGPWRRKA